LNPNVMVYGLFVKIVLCYVLEQNI